MQEAEVVLGVLRERGRNGVPLTQLYRQKFNKNLYLAAYGNIYSNQGSMTPGACGGTADGMSEAQIDEVIDLMRFERYRFAPARRVYIPKKNGRLRPLGIPSWRDKLVGEVVRLLLTATAAPNPAAKTPIYMALDAGAIPHCGRCATPGRGPCGSSRAISLTATGLLIMRS